MADICIGKAYPLQTLYAHSSDITCCDFDEKFHFASGSSDKKVVVHEWQTGVGFKKTFYSPIAEFKYGVSKIKFIPHEHELIASSVDGSISVFNTENGELLHVLMHVNVASIRTFCYIRTNNYLLSGADDGSACIFDLTRKSLLKSIQLHDETISVTCISRDSKIILSGDTTGFVKFWYVPNLCDTKTKSDPVPELNLPDCHDLGINQADFSPICEVTNRGVEYKLVTGGNDHLLKIWRLTCKKRDEIRQDFSCHLEFSIVGHGSAVTDVQFNSAGSIIGSTSLDKTARLWALDGHKYQCLKVLRDHKRYVTTCCFSSDGSLLATGSNDKTVIIWDLTGGRTLNSCLLNRFSFENVFNNNSLKRNNNPKIISKIENLGNAVNSCAFSKNNILAAGGTDKLVRLWHHNDGKFTEISTSPLRGHQYAVNQVDFSLCGTYLASCSVDGTTVLWNIMEYNQIGAVHGVDGSVKCCKFSPDSSTLATAGDNEIVYVWDVVRLLPKGNMVGHTDAISCLSYTSDSKYLASGCLSGNLRLWCVAPCITICLLCKENVHDMGVSSIDFCLSDVPSTARKKYLLVSGGNDSLVKLWEICISDEFTAKCMSIFHFLGHGGSITCVRFPSNSSRIVASTAIDKTARIWSTNLGTCLYVLDSKESPLTCCAFSVDGSYIATGTLDKTIYVWDLRNCYLDYTDIFEVQNENPEINAKVREHLRELNQKNDIDSAEMPHEFICPITQQIMSNPALCSDGYTYEKSAIESWFSSGKYTSPMTNEVLAVLSLVPNVELQNRIVKFVKEFSIRMY